MKQDITFHSELYEKENGALVIEIWSEETGNGVRLTDLHCSWEDANIFAECAVKVATLGANTANQLFNEMELLKFAPPTLKN